MNSTRNVHSTPIIATSAQLTRPRTSRQAVALSATLIVIYPCGMPLFFAVLLHHNRHSLRNQQHTAISAATAFLHRECGCRHSFGMSNAPPQILHACA